MGNPNHTNLQGLVVECDGISTDAGTTTLKTTTAATLTATTGSLPVAGGSTVIADTATPTVVELLDAIVEIRAKLTAAGVWK